MKEEEFVNRVLDTISQLEKELEKLSNIGICKTECIVKTNELVFWLMRYRDEMDLEEDR